MASLNRIMIIGHLGRDPESLEGETPRTRFSVATTVQRRDQEETTWFTVTAFGRQAETVAQYCKKGSLVCVDGTVRSWVGQKDGVDVTYWGVNANNVTFLGSPRDGDEATAKKKDNCPI